MQCLKKFRTAISLGLLLIGSALLLTWQHPLTTAQAATETNPQFEIPVLVQGFATAPGLPDGDVFLLPNPLQFTLQQPTASTELFAVSAETFGGAAETLGTLANLPARGFSTSQPGETVTALTGADSIWNGNLLLAGTPGAIGDEVRIFAQTGTRNGELLRFTSEAEGFRLTHLHSHLKLFVDNRFALGPDTKQDTLIPFVDEAGPRGQRTGLLTFALAENAKSLLPGCFQLGIEIKRAHSDGTISVVLTDLVVKRQRVTEDENNPGTGLLGRLSGGYPSGLPCAAECPPMAEPALMLTTATLKTP